MNPLLRDLAPRTGRARPRSNHTRARCGRDEDGFPCKHCQAFVSCDGLLSGVHNRNHCPYCLWSRHLDWHAPGDRLSACKALMRPLGLTVKQVHKRYTAGPGELMLIHCCQECGQVSINRLAADDVPQAVLAVFEASVRLSPGLQAQLAACGIRLLGPGDGPLVRSRLLGNGQAEAFERQFEPA
jgi:hypothetical protein